MGKYILAIDQGTTSTRAILFDRNLEIITSAQREFKQYFRNPGWVEHDANEIWMTTLAVIAEVLLLSNSNPADCAGIGITNQRETVVIWEKESGLPIAPAIVWQSRQSEEYCEKLRAEGYEDMIREKTGLRIDPYFSATKIRWLLDHVDGAEARMKRGELLIGTIDSWLVWKLSGGESHITDVTNASRTLLFNLKTMDWDPELCELFGVPLSALPKITDNSGILAKTVPYHFFNQEIPIAGLIGDQQAALFGQDGIRRGMIKNTYGTGGFILMNTGEDIIRSEHGLLSTVGYRMNGKTVYALEGSIFVSGSLIQWLRDGLGLIEHAADSEALAASVPDSDGVVIVPALVGLACPYWDDRCRGTIFHITRGTRRAHLVRAALEAMCYQVCDVIQVMEEETGIEIETLQVDGGASANNVLLQMQADCLKRPVLRADQVEATALGAAKLAGLAVGFWTSDDFRKTDGARFEPSVPAEVADAAMARWHRAVTACRKFSAEE